MRFPSQAEDGSEDIDPCGDGLSPLAHSRRVLGIRLCSRLLLGPKPNTLLLVVFNCEWEEISRQPARRDVASFLQPKAFLQCHGKGLLYLPAEQKDMITEGGIRTVRGSLGVAQSSFARGSFDCERGPLRGGVWQEEA